MQSSNINITSSTLATEDTNEIIAHWHEVFINLVINIEAEKQQFNQTDAGHFITIRFNNAHIATAIIHRFRHMLLEGIDALNLYEAYPPSITLQMYDEKDMLLSIMDNIYATLPKALEEHMIQHLTNLPNPIERQSFFYTQSIFPESVEERVARAKTDIQNYRTALANTTDYEEKNKLLLRIAHVSSQQPLPEAQPLPEEDRSSVCIIS
ncbi:MAG: hypothetical protein GW760_01720 [Legionella sp.]|jgi:hypothetical protein|nr:hypothetical protein [Legionella sp.]